MQVKFDCDVEQLRKDFVVALHNNGSPPGSSSVPVALIVDNAFFEEGP
jgi:hypothetical protein